MKTNNKIVKDAIQKYIINCIDIEEQGLPENITLAGQLEFICSEFKRVAGYEYNLRRLPNIQERFIDWLSGLPSYFNIEYRNYEIVSELMPSFNLPLPANKTEDQGVKLFYCLIYMNFLDLCKKHKVDFYKYAM